MKKFLLIMVILIGAVLFLANRLLSLDGTGGQSALITKGTDSKPLALITGATGKIGSELASLLDKEGYSLIIHGRNKQKLDTIAATLKDPELIIADFTKKEDRDRVIQLIHERAPALVINNAGIITYSDVIYTDPAWFSKTIEVNAIALTEFTIAAVQAMKKKNKQGIVLNISSISGVLAPWPYTAVYAGTKSYVTNFSVAFDFELKGTGIRVLTAQPGVVATLPNRDPNTRQFISTEVAAHEMYQQIKDRKTEYIFDNNYRFGAVLLKWLPDNIRVWVLSKLTRNIKPYPNQPQIEKEQ